MKAAILSLLLCFQSVGLLIAFIIWAAQAPDYHDPDKVAENGGEEQDCVTNQVGSDPWDFVWFVMGATSLVILVSALWIVQDFNSGDDVKPRYFWSYMIFILFVIGSLTALTWITNGTGAVDNYGMDGSTPYWASFGTLWAVLGLFGLSIGLYISQPGDRLSKLRKLDKAKQNLRRKQQKILTGRSAGTI